MENSFSDDGMEREPSSKELLDEGSISSEEEGFMRGYSDDGEGPTCDECGEAIRESKVVKLVDGETRTFCCDSCSQDFEESLG